MDNNNKKNNNSNEIPSNMNVISENFQILFSGNKNCPRCGTQMPASVTLCPNCSAYTPGIVGVADGRKVKLSRREAEREQNQKSAIGCLYMLVFAGVIVGLSIAVSKLPANMTMYGVAFILAVVSALIYLAIYLFTVSLYMKQVPKTVLIDNADQFCANFRLSGGLDQE